MKRFFIVFLALMFLSNTLIVSAWAKPCMMNDMKSAKTTQNMAMDKMPCHEDGKTKKQDPNKHCDGLCLCLHVSITQTPVLVDLVTVPDIISSAAIFTQANENITSRDDSPLRRPPKFIS